MLIINVCIGSACHLKGSYNVIKELQTIIEEEKLQDKVEIKGAFCLGHCTKAVSVKVEENIYSLAPENVRDFFKEEIMRRLQIEFC